MVARAATASSADLLPLLETIADPADGAERQAEARRAVYATIGPYADPVLRLCAQTAAVRRELALERARREDVRLRGIVTAVHDGRVRVLVGGTERDMPRPSAMTIGVGQTVFTDGEARTVVAPGELLLGGQTYVFVEALDAHHALVRSLRDGVADGARHLALVGAGVTLDALTPNDHVLGWSIDGGNVVLLTRRLDRPRPLIETDASPARTVRREDLVGLEDVLDRVEWLFLDGGPAYADALRLANGACIGVVLSGAPGVGKSLLAEYVAGCIRARGGLALYRTASHFLSKWVGEGAAALRSDFAALELAYEETGVRSLLVIDELEAIALDRQHAGAVHGGFIDVLDTLLSLLTRSSVRMIGISNVATRLLDAALVRDGRLPIVPFPATLGPVAVSELVARLLDGLALERDEEAVR